MTYVSLRAFERTDIPYLHHWMNDSESLLMVGRTPLSFEEVEQLIEQERKSGSLLLVIQNPEKTPLGWVHLSKIEQEHGRAEIGILLAPEHRGQGGWRGCYASHADSCFSSAQITSSVSHNASDQHSRYCPVYKTGLFD